MKISSVGRMIILTPIYMYTYIYVPSVWLSVEMYLDKYR